MSWAGNKRQAETTDEPEAVLAFQHHSIRHFPPRSPEIVLSDRPQPRENYAQEAAISESLSVIIMTLALHHNAPRCMLRVTDSAKRFRRTTHDQDADAERHLSLRHAAICVAADRCETAPDFS